MSANALELDLSAPARSSAVSWGAILGGRQRDRA